MSARLKLPEEEIEFEIAKLELRPGDVLVARLTRIVPSEALARLRAFLARELPDTKVLVIDAQVDLSIVSKAEAKKLESVMR